MFFGQVLPFDSPISIGLCSSVEVLTLPLGPLESAGRGKFIVIIAPLCAGDCCLPGTWSVSWQGVKKPLDTCPAYLNCGAWVTARGRHIYSLNILLQRCLPEGIFDSFGFIGLHETPSGFSASGRVLWFNASLPLRCLRWIFYFSSKYASPFGFYVWPAPSGFGTLRTLREFKEWLVLDHLSLVSSLKPFY